MKIIFTKHFDKIISKLNNITRSDVIKLIEKYPNTNKIKLIDSFYNSKVLKGYLYSNKLRILILFEKEKGIYVPISVVRKEAFKGENISKDNYIQLFGNDIKNTIFDKDNNNYEEISFT